MSQIVIKNAGTIKPTALSYLWHVNFSNACENTKNVGDYLKSPVFSTLYLPNKQEWQLHLFPRGDRKTDNVLSVYLSYLGQSNVNVNVSLSLLCHVSYKARTTNFTRLFEPQSLPFGSEFADRAFIMDRRNNIITNDTMSILCEITYLTAPYSNEPVEDKLPDYSRLKEFDDFEKLLEAENSADVTVNVMGKDEIKVHKAIIMSRSPVFQAMFEHDMKEKEQNTVEIIDVEYEVMKEVFRFMYAGKVKGIEKITGKLFVAADKYCITGLKVLCEKQLLQNLKVANAVAYLKLAEKCNANNLKSRIVKFIVRNAKDIVHKPELKQLPVEIVCEVLSAVVDNPANK